MTSIAADGQSYSLFYDDLSDFDLDWKTAAHINLLKAASLFTDPICKVREYFYELYTLSEVCKTTTEKVARAASLCLGVAFFALLAPFATPIGMALRSIVVATQEKPYIYLKSKNVEVKKFVDKKITEFSQNVCGMEAGYHYTDAGLVPFRAQIEVEGNKKSRCDANLDQIRSFDPDVVCLFEVPNIYDACHISSYLKNYARFVPVAGTRILGPPSMIYVASKYEMENITFTPFIKGEELTGPSRFSEKGVLSFDLKSEDKPFATVIATHLQHSAIPEHPSLDEKASRRQQMLRVAQVIRERANATLPVIFTGDLNMDEAEAVDVFGDDADLNRLVNDRTVCGQPTWGGDAWCATKLRGEESSKPLRLDYTAVSFPCTIETKVVNAGFDGAAFDPNARSDHKGLLSTIIVDCKAST